MRSAEVLERLTKIFPNQTISLPPEFNDIEERGAVDDSNSSMVRYSGECYIDMTGKNLSSVLQTIRNIFKKTDGVNEFSVRTDSGERFTETGDRSIGMPWLILPLKTIGGDKDDSDIAVDRSEVMLAALEAHKEEIQAEMAAPQTRKGSGRE